MGQNRTKRIRKKVGENTTKLIVKKGDNCTKADLKLIKKIKPK
jgi:hypothetical protein